MNKTILLVSGVPSGKARFEELAKTVAWVWNINPKNYLADNSKNVGWNGVRDDTHYKFISEYLSLVNKYFGFEQGFLEGKIKTFTEDESQQKQDKATGAVFSAFILMLHGVSKDKVTLLKEEYGAFKIHITKRSLNSNFIPDSDVVLYEDDDNFDAVALQTIKKLTNQGE